MAKNQTINQEEGYRFFSTHLLAWYYKHHRKLPWRESKNAYYIWVSEVMLQQTRVETVIPYFERFIEQFPTIEALAEAPEEEVLKAWEGLGYYSRARNLQSAVREVKELYGGVVPEDKDQISSLKGVGPYTAGAVLSIAYNKPEPAVDGNVMRVLSRFFLIKEDIARNSTRVLIERLAKQLIPDGQAGDFNQALMELGATVCTPRSPYCLTCPVMACCAARLEGLETELPVKKKAKPPRPENRVAAFIRGTGKFEGKFLIRQRPAKGLLAEMWELPHFEVPQFIWNGSNEDMSQEEEIELMKFLRENLSVEEGVPAEPISKKMLTTHTFSHIHWNMVVFSCQMSAIDTEMMAAETAAAVVERRKEERGEIHASEWSSSLLPPRYRWISKDEMGKYAFPNVFLRIINEGP